MFGTGSSGGKRQGHKGGGAMGARVAQTASNGRGEIKKHYDLGPLSPGGGGDA